jgi:hypothetical protein
MEWFARISSVVHACAVNALKNRLDDFWSDLDDVTIGTWISPEPETVAFKVNIVITDIEAMLACIRRFLLDLI